MAKITNVQDRYDIRNSVREDLTDFITNVDPDDTPVFSSLKKAKAEQTYHEYQRDVLRSPNADNAAIDGDTATTSARTAPTRIGNYCQIFQQTVGVSGRAERVRKAGVKSMLAYNKAMTMIELKRDVEAMILSNNLAVSGSTGVASKSAGIGPHIYTNALHGTGGATPAHTSGSPGTAATAGTNRAFTDALLKTALAGAYNASGKAPKMIVMSASHKQTASAFAGVAANHREAGNKGVTIIGAADYYLSDFGLSALVPHYILLGRSEVFGLDPSALRVAYLREWQEEKLGRKGDATEEQILVDLSLEVRSEKNMFKIANLTP